MTANNDIKTTFEETIAGKYTLISPFREDIVELRCEECGEYFLSTPYRILSAWGCPTCDGKVDDAILFRHLFETAAKGEYTLLSDFLGTCEKVPVLHKKCGRTYSISARDFLESNIKCACTKRAEENDIREQIEALGEFELLQYHQKASVPILLRHKICGNTFSAKFNKFIKKPHCYLCRREELNRARTKSHSTYIQDVADVVGNEYTVMEPYIADVSPIAIRHNVCGEVQKYRPSRFLTGQRCHACHQSMSNKAFDRFVTEVSLGRYTCVKHISSYRVIIRDTVTELDKTMMVSHVRQELLRQTPSPLLPLEQRNLNITIPTGTSKKT